MAAFSFPSYISAPASNNNAQVSARFPNVSHQQLGFSPTIASSSSSLTLKCPVLSLPAPSNTTLNKGEIVADNHFRFHPLERPHYLKVVHTLMHAAKYKRLGKSQKKAYKLAIVELMAESVVVMEDLKDYYVVNAWIKNGVWVPNFMIHKTTNDKFRNTLEKRTMKLGVPDFMIHKTTNDKFRDTLEKRTMKLGNTCSTQKEEERDEEALSSS